MKHALLLVVATSVLVAGCVPVCDRVAVTDFLVERVIDGDTFVVRYDGESTSVRLLAPVSDRLPPPAPIEGYNAPELRDPGGREAADDLRRQVEGRRVRLSWPLPHRRDHFGRLLATAAIVSD